MAMPIFAMRLRAVPLLTGLGAVLVLTWLRAMLSVAWNWLGARGRPRRGRRIGDRGERVISLMMIRLGLWHGIWGCLIRSRDTGRSHGDELSEDNELHFY